MANNKKMVEDITSMEVDFAKWYTDIVKKAELCDYSSRQGLHDRAPVRLCDLGKHPAYPRRRV